MTDTRKGGAREGAGRPRQTPDAAEYRFLAEMTMAHIGKGSAPFSDRQLVSLGERLFTLAEKAERATGKAEAPAMPQPTGQLIDRPKQRRLAPEHLRSKREGEQ